MQRSASLKQNKKNDRRNCQTPDRLDISVLNTTSVMSPRRKTTANAIRTNTSSTIGISSLRKLELENNNLELELMYSNYIASVAEKVLEEKALIETEKKFIKLVKNIHEETKILNNKCRDLKLRNAEIELLINLKSTTDNEIKNIEQFEELLDKNNIGEILGQLRKLLNKFDVLRCENIIVPENSKELKQLQNLLSECIKILEDIDLPVDPEMMEDARVCYESYNKTYSEILNIKEVLEEKINNLQIDVLKSSAHCLAEIEE